MFNQNYQKFDSICINDSLLKQLNCKTFTILNFPISSSFEFFFIALDFIGNPRSFPFYMFALFILFFAQQYSNNNYLKFQKKFSSFFIFNLSFFFSFFIAFLTAIILKKYVEEIRPFCALLEPNHIHAITNNLICTESFPSGHATFATIILVNFWYQKKLRFILILYFVLQLLSRLIIGAHFPHDLLAGIIIAISAHLLSQFLVNKNTNKILGSKILSFTNNKLWRLLNLLRNLNR